MAVLVEGISVIARRDQLDVLFPGGSEQYIADCPNATACADQHLVRVGFMAPEPARSLIQRLESLGLTYLNSDGKAQDIVVVDQLRGLMSKCDWVEYGHVNVGANQVAAARMVGDTSTKMFLPPRWVFENSLSHQYQHVPREQLAVRMKFLREADGLYVYFDPNSRQRFYSPAPPSQDQVEDLHAILELMGEGEDSLALTRVQQLLASDPTSGAGWAVAGACLKALGQIDEATAALSRAIDLGHTDTTTLFLLAQCHKDSGNTESTRALLTQAITNDPDSYAARHALALLHFDSKQYSLAATAADQALLAYARVILGELTASNHFEGPIEPEPALTTQAWVELPAYAAIYSTALEAGLTTFHLPSAESAEAEARNRTHGGLYWFDTTDSDGTRSRRFLPNFFNAFCQRCCSNPLYPLMLTVRGNALQAVGDDGANIYLTEAAVLSGTDYRRI